MKPTQVMIVEDEALIGIDIQDNLENYGYNVIGISTTGESAIENATRTRPEVILMDIQLNGKMDGIETAKQIRQILDIPIIYLTAYADDKTLTKALEASPAGYLLKPFVPRELHTSIQTALHKNAVDKEGKINRLSYIQRNILKRKNLQLRLDRIGKDKDEFPYTVEERKLARLKYIRNTISKRKKNEALLQSEMSHREKLETLLGNLLFSQAVDSSTPHIFPLKEFATVLEYEKEEIERMGNLIIFLLLHPEDFFIMEEYYRQILFKPGDISEIEFRLKHKSGVWRWFSSKGVYQEVEKEKGKILHSAKDITWAKNLQYTSHIMREKFRAISDNPYFGIAVLDADAKIMSLNPTLEHLTGYTKEDLNWLNFSDYIGLKELRSICQNFEKLKMGVFDSFQAEAFIHTKHKGAFWGYVVFNAIYSPEKNIDRIVCSLVDISESKLFDKNTNNTRY